ncbi:MAG: mitochondrial fission ELM1 family protein [Proteobacteria bacterium]|nr:mitochondrial fission ELM1 family protein [Pseudomonadota bacterium]MBU1714461.1 mitochondrial fission ELM1 family protein [Pseudomonadota bacterium]
MKPLAIHAFFDTRKGHEKQTRGVLQALAALTPVQVTEHRLPLPSLLTRITDWLRYLLAPILPDRKINLSDTDLIIGTGSRCHIPMLLAGRQNRASNPKIITSMSPDRILLNKFDLCLVPLHDDIPEADNILKTTGPPCPVSNKGQHDKAKGLILIGGINNKSHHWQTPVITKQVKEVIKADPEIHWTVSSSPRTPTGTIELLEIICRECDNADFFRAEDTGDGWIEKQYEQNSTVWVTADSMSMTYEALSAGCRVGVFPIKWKKNNNKYQRSLASLIEKNLILPFEEWQKGKSFGRQTLLLDEAGVCAKEILKRWWPEKLQ